MSTENTQPKYAIQTPVWDYYETLHDWDEKYFHEVAIQFIEGKGKELCDEFIAFAKENYSVEFDSDGN